MRALEKKKYIQMRLEIMSEFQMGFSRKDKVKPRLKVVS